jgi:hypothetical protein
MVTLHGGMQICPPAEYFTRVEGQTNRGRPKRVREECDQHDGRDPLLRDMLMFVATLLLGAIVTLLIVQNAMLSSTRHLHLIHTAKLWELALITSVAGAVGAVVLAAAMPRDWMITIPVSAAFVAASALSLWGLRRQVGVRGDQFLRAMMEQQSAALRMSQQMLRKCDASGDFASEECAIARELEADQKRFIKRLDNALSRNRV